jgi:hypothetical protein
MSVAPLRITSNNSRLLYLHVWQILNKIQRQSVFVSRRTPALGWQTFPMVVVE